MSSRHIKPETKPSKKLKDCHFALDIWQDDKWVWLSSGIRRLIFREAKERRERGEVVQVRRVSA